MVCKLDVAAVGLVIIQAQEDAVNSYGNPGPEICDKVLVGVCTHAWINSWEIALAAVYLRSVARV